MYKSSVSKDYISVLISTDKTSYKLATSVEHACTLADSCAGNTSSLSWEGLAK